MKSPDPEELPCAKDRVGKYDFECINQLCPYNMDVFYCYHSFSDEIKELFDELFELRSGLSTRSEVKVERECIPQI